MIVGDVSGGSKDCAEWIRLLRSRLQNIQPGSPTSKLACHPLVVVATENEEAAFAPWRTTAASMSYIALIMSAIIIIAACLIARSWQQQERLNRASADVIESDKTRALAEAELNRQQDLAEQNMRFNAAVQNMSQGLCMFARLGVSPTMPRSCAPRSDQVTDHDQHGRNSDTGLQRNARLEPRHGCDQLQSCPYRPLGIVLMGLRIAVIHEHTIAHIFRHEPTEAGAPPRRSFLIGGNDLAQVLRVHADGERRRTHQVRAHHRDLAPLGSVFSGPVDCRKSVGRRRFSRLRQPAGQRWRRAACGGCPTITTPRSFKSSAAKRGRTFSLIAFSRNAASYCSRPRLRSQPPRSMIAPELNRAHMIIQGKRAAAPHAIRRRDRIATG